VGLTWSEGKKGFGCPSIPSDPFEKRRRPLYEKRAEYCVNEKGKSEDGESVYLEW